MDKLDLRLLYELNWNCRQSHTELGKKLHVSKQVVRYRILQLEEKKVIQSYHALIDWRRLGYNSIRVYIKWHHIKPEEEQAIYEEVKNDSLFMWTMKFEGEFDFAFYVWIKEVPEFSQKWFAFLSKYKKFILRYEIYESVNMVHYPMKIISDKSQKEEKVIGNMLAVDFDEVDYNILRIITENAAISLIDLARKIKLTPKAALYRLRALEKKKIILGYNALIDTEKLGYHFYKIDFYLNNLVRIKEMFEFAKQHKNIIYLMRTIGGPDFEIEVMVKDVIEMNEIVAEIKQRFAESIEYSRFHRFEYTIKQVYLPGKG